MLQSLYLFHTDPLEKLGGSQCVWVMGAKLLTATYYCLGEHHFGFVEQSLELTDLSKLIPGHKCFGLVRPKLFTTTQKHKFV